MTKRRLTVICAGAGELDDRWERLVGDQPRVFIDDPRFLMSFISMVDGEGFNEVTRVVFGPAIEEPAVDRFSEILCAIKECDVVHLRSEGEARVSRISRTGRRTDLNLDRSDSEQYFAPAVERDAFDVRRSSFTNGVAAQPASYVSRRIQA